MSLLTEEPQRRNGFDGQEDDLLWDLSDPMTCKPSGRRSNVWGLEPLGIRLEKRERHGGVNSEMGIGAWQGVNKGMWEREMESSGRPAVKGENVGRLDCRGKASSLLSVGTQSSHLCFLHWDWQIAVLRRTQPCQIVKSW